MIANLHWFPDQVQGRLGDGADFGVEVTYRHEEELLGTAGGVRNVADFLTAPGEDFLVLAGDALTDADLTALRRAQRANDGVATLGVKKVTDVSEYGVVVTGSDGRVQGFQEKPDPAEALSDLVNCMVYAFSPEIFDYFPDDELPDPVDFANDVFPALLAGDVPFHVHEIESYWNDVGTLPEYLQGNLDAVEGAVELPALGGELGDGEAPAGARACPPSVEVDGQSPVRPRLRGRRRRVADRAAADRRGRLDRGGSPGQGGAAAARRGGRRTAASSPAGSPATPPRLASGDW